MSRNKLLLLSLCSGCLLSIPWMANAGSWILLMAFIPLLIVDDQLHRHNRAGIAFFFYALAAFLTWNILSTWWIAYVSFAGMLIIALINAALMSGVCWLAHSIRRTLDIWTAYFSLIIFWITFEYLHFHWSMQWPWLILGNGFASSIEWIQWYEYTGVLGGSLWILMVNVLLYAAIKHLKKISVKALKVATGLALLIILPLSWSFYRYDTFNESRDRIRVAVLQPNIDPYKDKFAGLTYEEQTRRMVSLAQSVAVDSIQYVVAPETALEPLWENDSMRRQKSLPMFDTLFSSHPGLRVIAGAITQKKIQKGDPVSYAARHAASGDLYEVYNSSLFFDHSQEIQIGHKSILVSGVEKIPFQQYFPFLSNYIVDAGGVSGSLTPADQPTVFKSEGGEGIGTIICFESVFGSFVGSTVKKGASILFVITNDGWWKESYGLTQHFNYSRLRAVETRRSIARSANTGLSGFINQRGEVIKITSSNTESAISAFLALNDQLTFYVKNGDYLGWISAVLSVMAVLYVWGRKMLG